MKPYPLYSITPFSTIRELIDVAAEKYQDASAYSWQTKDKQKTERTYLQTQQDIRIACYQLSQHVKVYGHVAILGENSYNWIIGYMAIVYGGRVIVPMDKDAPLSELLEKLRMSDSDVLLLSDTYKDYMEPVKQQGVKVILFSEIEQMCAEKKVLSNADVAFPPVDKDTLASIVFTSGTTGQPKGVMLTHGNLASDAFSACSHVMFEGDGILLLPLHHTYGLVAAVLCAAVHGKSVFINKSLRYLANDLKATSPQHIVAVPLIIETLYKSIWSNAEKTGKAPLLKKLVSLSNLLRKVHIDLRRVFFRQVIDGLGGNLSMMISGGAPISETYIQGFDALGITVLNGYGITECAPIVAVNRNKYIVSGSVGTPLLCNEVQIAPDGEILVRGTNVMQGYYHQEEATKSCLINGWFHTGDIGMIDKYGALHITGRKKNLIILSNGENVAAEELEQRILDHIDFVKEVIVTGTDKGIEAEIYLDPDVPDAQQRIHSAITALNQKTVSTKRIDHIRLRDTEFPKTTTKKIKRTAVKTESNMSLQGGKEHD